MSSIEDDEWPKNKVGKSLCQFEESLRCKMCRDYYDNPQILPCGHTFCAICLTKRFDRKLNPNATDSCPQCRESVQTTKMKLNHELAHIVDSFKSIRNDLHGYMTKTSLYDLDASTSRDLRKSSREKASKESESSVVTGRTMITKKIPLRNFHGEPVKKVRDALLSVSSNSSCISLLTSGDHTTLEKRYRAFVHLHNAQFEKPSPLSLEEVVTQINEEEAMASKEAWKEAKSLDTLNSLKNGKVSRIAHSCYRYS
jgi:hypothetical protein